MRFFIIILIAVSIGCTDHKQSEIRVIKISDSLLDSIQKGSDSVVIEQSGGDLYATIETYYWDDSKFAKRFLKDSLGNVRSIIDLKNEKYHKSRHFYANGQLKGDLSYSDNGELNGPATYYHSNGRIKETGKFRDNHRVGIWKKYNKEGQLMSIKHFSDKGVLIDSTEV